MTTVEHAWRIFKLLEEHWPTVPADDLGPKFPLDFSVRPSPRREGAVIVMFRSTRKYQKEKWAAFAEAAQMPFTGQGSPHSGPQCLSLLGTLPCQTGLALALSHLDDSPPSWARSLSPTRPRV